MYGIYCYYLVQIAFITRLNFSSCRSCLTWRERVGREVGGGIGMGKTCEPKAFSFQCMTKFTTNKKNNNNNPEVCILKKKKKKKGATISPRGPCALNSTVLDGAWLTDPAPFILPSKIVVLTKGFTLPMPKMIRCSNDHSNPHPASSHYQLVVHHCASGSDNNYSSQLRDVWRRLQVPLWVLCLTFQKEVLSYALACPLARN